MTEMTPLTVGEVAERFGVTVRTLHYYDEIGLLRPSRRSPAGYRQYTEADLTRLQHVVVYRRLGFALEAIAELLDDPAADVAEHLRRQRIAVTARMDEMRDLITAIDHALEVHMSGTQLTEADRRELFGPHHDEYAAEAEQRWGHTEAWAQSQQRTARYTKQDWVTVKAEADATAEAIATAMRSGLPAISPAAMDAAETHRRHIHDRFYHLSYDMHRRLGEMYITDVRFMRNYDDVEPGLAQYLRDAIHANADRQQS